MNRNVLLMTNMVRLEPTVALVVLAVSEASTEQVALADLKISSQASLVVAVHHVIQTPLVKVTTSSIAFI